ncbi:histidine kinase [Calderihabitans maritimus]|uniref:histidine kinase n=1 Tax=Calderihabitans maritimus TaxID=1246530 RepID=A0A1Z5HTI4_9FIRM|nr:histidine kinase [Calderihabitans maritimus]GAW92748.1 Signal transduction histidine kinase, LytS [Calderihabitans maritimus]
MNKQTVEWSAFDIAHETLTYLKQGLNMKTAQKVAEIIQNISDVDAVAITDQEKILGFAGAGCKNHRHGRSIVTNATKEAIDTGILKVIQNPKDFNCPVSNDCTCPLKSAVIAPLFCEGEVIGALKLYQVNQQEISPKIIKLASGIARILSIQIELAEKERLRQLVAQARLEALQARIRPHFIFNVLNTIIVFSRTDVEKARQLLVQLAKFFRKTLQDPSPFISLREEMEYVETYLYLEQARFGDNLRVHIKVEEAALDVEIPVLCIQPLVENAVMHGITPRSKGGNLTIICKLKRNKLKVLVLDDGVGISKSKLAKIFQPGFGSGNSLALRNIKERLLRLYGREDTLRIRSRPGCGTAILLSLPLQHRCSIANNEG